MKRLVLFPYTFVLMNWAAVVGLYHFLRGQHDVWSGYEYVESPAKANRLHEVAESHETETSEAA